MYNELLTSGEFAQYAGTTRRTVHWYTQKKLLVPTTVNNKKYQWYSPRQLVDLQAIALLRASGQSLHKIAASRSQQHGMQAVFAKEKAALEKHIGELKRRLVEIDQFYFNLETEGALVNPKQRVVKSRQAWLLEVVGTPNQSAHYSQILRSHFANFPPNPAYFLAYMGTPGGQKKGTLRVGVLAEPGMEIKPESIELVSKVWLPQYRALTYVHYGQSQIVPLLWQEMERYRQRNSLLLLENPQYTGFQYFYSPTSTSASRLPATTIELHLQVAKA